MSSEGGVTLGFDLDAGPIASSIDRVGASSERAAASADKLAAAGERMATSLKSAAGSQEQLVRDTLALNAVLNQAEKVASTANTIDLANKRAVTSLVTEISAVRALAAEMGGLARVDELTAQALATLDARQREVALSALGVATAQKAAASETAAAGAAAASAGASAGVLERALGSVLGVATGAGTGIAGLAGSLASMVIGGVLMAGVIAAIGALIGWWDKLTESVRKSKEEHERAIAVLDRLRQKQDLGPAGETGQATAIRTKDLAEAEARLRRLEDADRIRQQVGGAEDPRLAAARRDVINLRDLVARGNAESARLRKEASDSEQRDNAQALAQRLQFNQKDAAARREALALLARDRAEYARLVKLPETPSNSKEIARVAREMKELDDALNPKTRTPRARRSDEQREMDAITAALRQQADEAARAEAAKTKASADAVAATTQEVAEAQLLLDALRNGTQAYKDQAREIEILHALEREGISLSDPRYEEERKRLEQLYRLRDAIGELQQRQREADAEAKRGAEQAARAIEQRFQALRREVAGTAHDFFSDLLHGQNPFPRLGERLKDEVARALAEAFEQRWTVKIAEILGIEVPATKQERAGRDMQEAADKQLAAARAFLEAAGYDPGSVAAQRYAEQFSTKPTLQPTQPIVPGERTPSRNDGWQEQRSILDMIESKLPASLAKAFETARKYAGPAIAGGLAGYQVGESVYSTSHGTVGNYVRGALGGAVSGAAAGAAVGGVPGAIVGGVAGFIGGIIGVHNASKEAAKATEELRKQLELNMASLRATVNHDDLGQAIAQANAQREQLRKQIEDAYSGGDRNSATVRERNRQLAEMNALEDKYIAQLKEEAAAKSRYFTEDLGVEQERARADIAEAQGRADEAARLRKDADQRAYNESQERRLEEYRRTHNMDDPANQAQYAELQRTVALNEQAYALKQNTAALNALTTTVRNAPSGFKLEDYVQQYARALPYPGTQALNPLPVPVNPFVPPTAPLTPSQPALSRTGTTATSPAQINWTGDIVIEGSKLDKREIAKAVVAELDLKVGQLGGSINSSRADALEAYN